MEKVSNKCMFNHSILDIPNDKNNEQLNQIKQHYIDYLQRSVNEKGERIFKDFCLACIDFKLGFFWVLSFWYLWVKLFEHGFQSRIYSKNYSSPHFS